MLHGIVDSLWLKKQDATIEDYKALCKKVSKDVDVTLNFEGRYKWIVFLPSKIHPNIGVLNRYYGVMENGKIKVRGLEVRRHDTPQFICDAQTEMINTFAEANNSTEFIKKIPQALKIVKNYRKKLIDGKVAVRDLIVTKRLSKNPKRYRQRVSQAIAAGQLIMEGEKVSAGKKVSFLFTNSGSKRFERRVIAEQLLDKEANIDIEKYLFLLYDSAASLLSFYNYSTERVHDAVIGHKKMNLNKYLT